MVIAISKKFNRDSSEIMDVIKTAIKGVVLIEPKIFKDARCYFFESSSQSEFEEKVRKINFVQDNESKSSYGVFKSHCEYDKLLFSTNISKK